MKNVFFMAAIAAVCVACSSDNGEEPVVNQGETAEVVLTFSPYEVTAMTRAVTNVSEVVTKLDVWLYESGAEVEAFHQASTDDDFGTITATLDKTKTYTLYAVGHRCASAATLADGIISFPEDKVTHSMFYSTTFSPATTVSLNCLMQRIVSQFVFSTTDQCPNDVAKMTFTINGVYDRWDVSSGGTHSLDRTSTFSNFSKMQDGTVTFNIYAIVTDAETTHDITVTAYDAQDDEIQTRTFANVPLRNGYRTRYRGVYFTDTEVSAAFTVGDWNEYDVVEF